MNNFTYPTLQNWISKIFSLSLIVSLSVPYSAFAKTDEQVLKHKIQRGLTHKSLSQYQYFLNPSDLSTQMNAKDLMKTQPQELYTVTPYKNSFKQKLGIHSRIVHGKNGYIGYSFAIMNENFKITYDERLMTIVPAHLGETKLKVDPNAIVNKIDATISSSFARALLNANASIPQKMNSKVQTAFEKTMNWIYPSAEAQMPAYDVNKTEILAMEVGLSILIAVTVIGIVESIRHAGGTTKTNPVAIAIVGVVTVLLAFYGVDALNDLVNE